MVVVRAFGGAEDGCASCDVHASVVAEEPGGPCTVCLTGKVGTGGSAPLRLPPALVPVAQRLLADGVAAFAGVLAACGEGSALPLAAAGDLQLWVRHTDGQPRVIALAHRSGAGEAMVAAPHGEDIYVALGRVERYLRGIGVLPPLPRPA